MWGKILKKLLITGVRSNEEQAGDAVLEICASKMERIDRTHCSDLLQYAEKLQEAMERIEWAVRIFKPQETREEMMNVYGRMAIKRFKDSLNRFENATWKAVRMAGIAYKDRVAETVKFIHDNGGLDEHEEESPKGAYQ